MQSKLFELILEYKKDLGETFPYYEAKHLSEKELIKLLQKCIDEDIEARELLDLDPEHAYY